MEKKIIGIVFRVKNPKDLAKWYQNVLGMKITNENGDDSKWLCEYEGQGARVKLIQGSGSAFKADRGSVYWKIGLALPDVDLAREKISSKGTSVSLPSQFKDIGYLCHCADPDGFSIELLQHTFEENFVKPQIQQDLALGQKGLIGQITLRCSDIEKSLKFYQDLIGMKLLSIQDQVKDYGFTLYFLAFTREDAPLPDLESPKIREWLWQRPYTTLELQYISGGSFKGMSKENLGVDSMQIRASKSVKENLINAGIQLVQNSKDHCQAYDPDGALVSISFTDA